MFPSYDRFGGKAIRGKAAISCSKTGERGKLLLLFRQEPSAAVFSKAEHRGGKRRPLDIRFLTCLVVVVAMAVFVAVTTPFTAAFMVAVVTPPFIPDSRLVEYCCLFPFVLAVKVAVVDPVPISVTAVVAASLPRVRRWRRDAKEN